MPVHLNAVPSAASMPPPPGVVVWSMLLVTFISAGAAITLYLWRAQAKATGIWFWLCLLVFPLLVWAFLFGIRLFAHDLAVNSVRTRNRRREDTIRSETTRGQRSLTVLASAYETSLGHSNIGEKLSNGGIGFQSVKQHSGAEAIQCALLGENIPEKEITVDFLTRLIARVLTRIEPTLTTLPGNVPIHVRLQIDGGGDSSVIDAAWGNVSRAFASRVSSTFSIEGSGVLSLDRWLDAGEPELKKSAFLVVAIQLYPVAADGVAEGISALLLGRGLRNNPDGVIAHIHRPVEFDAADIAPGFSEALLWGKQDVSEIEGLWTGGMESDALQKVTAIAGGSELDRKQNQGLIHFDLNAALGHLGVVAAWLATAAAIERCEVNSQPQFIACSEYERHRMLVVSAKTSSIEERA